MQLPSYLEIGVLCVNMKMLSGGKKGNCKANDPDMCNVYNVYNPLYTPTG